MKDMKGMKGMKGKHHSEETKAKIRLKVKGINNGMYGKIPWNKGKKITEEMRIKLIKSHLGHIPWNKGIKGEKYLKHFKDESTWLMKNRTAEMGKKTGQTLKKLHSEGKIHSSPKSEFKKGMHASPKSEFKKGHIPWNKGKKGIHLSPDTEFKKGNTPIAGFKKGFIPWNKDNIYLYNKLCNIAKERGGECLSKEYTNGGIKLKFKCKEGHNWKAIANSIISKKSWCPFCLERRTEKHCRKIFEEIFNVKFKKRRYKWLRFINPLELDGFNESIITPIGLGLAFEYNGKQHYEFISYFQKTKKNFIRQIKRDKFKIKKCKEKGVLLIIIPYTVKYNDIENYIMEQLQINGVLLTSIKIQKKITEYN